jgi:mRNA interferase RelE/StbE
MYTVVWEKSALSDLKKLDKTKAKNIVNKVEHYLSQDPENLGKPLSSKFSGLYRYRLGDYRVIYELYKKEVKIMVVKVGHRREIYN